jgi:hypothetical protein
MMAGEDKAIREQDPLAINYLLTCMAAMVVVLLLLLRRGLGTWALVPALFGLAGVIFRLRFAPLLTFAALAATLSFGEPLELAGFRSNREALRPFSGSLPDWILSVAVLGYLIAHYRLTGLTTGADGKNEEEPATAMKARRGSAPAELSWFILCLPVWALLAQATWMLIPRGSNPYELDPPAWQGVSLAWLLALGGYLVAGLLGYIAWQRQSRSEALLWLQDVVWRETWRDQRRLGRELARCGLRRQRKEKR